MVNYKTDGKCKAFIRNEIKNIILSLSKCSTPLKVFTLPNLNFEVENLAINKGASVTCCEIDKQIYKQQTKIANKNINLINKKMSLVVKNNVWDVAWLDACGPISKELLDSLDNIKISKDGQLIVTIGAAREHPNYRIGDRIQFYIDYLISKGFHTSKIYQYRDYTFPMLCFFCNKDKTKITEIFQLI